MPPWPHQLHHAGGQEWCATHEDHVTSPPIVLRDSASRGVRKIGRWRRRLRRILHHWRPARGPADRRHRRVCGRRRVVDVSPERGAGSRGRARCNDRLGGGPPNRSSGRVARAMMRLLQFRRLSITSVATLVSDRIIGIPDKIEKPPDCECPQSDGRARGILGLKIPRYFCSPLARAGGGRMRD